MPKLKFVGKTDPQGRPLEFYESVPARDLDEQEVKAIKERDPDLFKALTRERKTPAGNRPALYQEVATPKKTAAKPATSEADRAKRRERDQARRQRQQAEADARANPEASTPLMAEASVEGGEG